MSEQRESTIGTSDPPIESARFAPLFPRWVNASFRLFLSMSAMGLVAVPASLVAWARTPYATGAAEPASQPVLFDHRHHTHDDGIDCRYCHHAVDRSPNAGVPSTDVCMHCHAQVWNRAPAVALVRSSYFTDTPIAWERVFNVPDFVFFNHAVHVRRNVGCVTCHGRIDLMAQVYMPEAMTMDWCLDCHRAPENYLRPAEHITDMEWTPRRPQRDLGLAIKAENNIAPPTNCTGCHR
jgi:hypothetical protein